MRRSALFFALLLGLMPSVVEARVVTDTLVTADNDRVIVRYSVSDDDGNITLRFADDDPGVKVVRIIPSTSSQLRKAAKGNLDKLKVVVFDRVGDFGDIKWKGITPGAFMIPAGISYDKSAAGYYIFGECGPMHFRRTADRSVKLELPVYIALYEKKQTYKLLTRIPRPMTVDLSPRAETPARGKVSDPRTVTIETTVETEEDNSAVTKALSSIDLVRQLLAVETELPFSQALQMEIYNLRALKNDINDPAVVERINDVIMEYTLKEKELNAARAAADQAAQDRLAQQAEQQRQEQEQLRKDQEEKALQQEEKQQRRTIWMIIGGAIIAVLAFVGNALFRSHRDKANQKSMMEMQASLTREAEGEAKRRAREVIRNKAHQSVNKGRTQLRKKLQETGGKKNGKSDKNIKSI